MTPSREDAYVALKAKLVTIPGIKTCTRRLKHWMDVPPEMQPAIYLQVGGDSRSNAGRRLPKRIELEAKLWLYVATTEDKAGEVINPLLDRIDDALDPPSGNDAQTLGDIVQHCWIEGTIQVFEGDLGRQAVAIVPVNMLLTPYSSPA